MEPTALELRIAEDIKVAMREKNPAKLTSLRAIKTQFGVLEKSGKAYTEADQLKVLQKMINQQKEAIDLFIKGNRHSLAQASQDEITVIESYLPKQMTKEEIEVEVNSALISLGLETLVLKDMGRVIGIVSKKLTGQADGKLISEVVKSKVV